MIPGSRGGRARSLRAAALALAAGACVLLPGLPAAAGVIAPNPSWVQARSWRAGAAGLPPACSPAAGTTGGVRLAPSRVGFAGGRLRIAPADTRDGHSGITCRTRLPDAGRVVLRARLPETPGVLTWIGVSPTPPGDGPRGCGLAVTGRGTQYVSRSLPSGSGKGADVVLLRDAPAGSTHVFTLTWTATTFTVAVDGREVHREPAGCGAGAARWLTIGATTTGREPHAEPLVVTALAVETPPPPAGSGTVAALPGAGRAPAAPRSALSAVHAVPAVPVPAAAAKPLLGQVGSEVDGRLPDAVAALQTTAPPGPWPLAGTCAGVGVLLGVLRAAIAARRRPVAGA
jgi:hypothetical protein